ELDEVRNTAEQAISLSPNLAEGHVALGAYYVYGRREFDQALAEFGRALELQPNNLRALDYAAHIRRRQGQWSRYLSEMAKCEELDPRDGDIPGLIGGTYCRLRMWDEANRGGQRALALDPRNIATVVHVLLPTYFGRGDIEGATRLVATFPADLFIAQSFK